MGLGALTEPIEDASFVGKLAASLPRFQLRWINERSRGNCLDGAHSDANFLIFRYLILHQWLTLYFSDFFVYKLCSSLIFQWFTRIQLSPITETRLKTVSVLDGSMLYGLNSASPRSQRRAKIANTFRQRVRSVCGRLHTFHVDAN